jgi:hypothetical protein
MGIKALLEEFASNQKGKFLHHVVLMRQLNYETLKTEKF